jgi:outer membrane protein OmpA-like peptidoglycan-associated protein
MTDPNDDDIAAAGWWTTERKEMGIALAVLLFFGWLMAWFMGWGWGSYPESTPVLSKPAPVVEERAVLAQAEIAEVKEEKAERRDPKPAAAVATAATAAAVVPKPVEARGCPAPEDNDKDGVENASDQCPDEAGTVENRGCPEPAIEDDDKDGVENAVDQCPDRAGTVENRGCPESKLSESVQATLNDAVSNVSFATNSAVLTDSSKEVLNAVADVLKNNEQYDLVISGHSDSSGDAQKNLILSAERAKACAVYIVEQGVDVSRIRASGFGATSPRDTNETPEGRKRNRRVEFQLVER